MILRGLKGKTAIITGAAQGIGLATAFRLAEEGVNLGLIDRAKITNNVLVALKKFKIKIMVCRADVRNYMKVKNFLARQIKIRLYRYFD